MPALTQTPQQLAQSLSEMTGLRDREQLQACVVRALARNFRPRSAQLCRRPDGLGDGAPWLLQPVVGTEAWAATGDTAQATAGARHLALARGEPVQLPGSPWRSFYPLVTQRGTDAVLELSFDAPPTEGRHQVAEELLRAYANLVDLLDYSERDTLTGLLNRKTFDETFMRMSSPLPPEWPPAQGHEGRRHWHSDDPGFLAVLDIDHFKRVNDRFGHLVGDEALLLVARLMADTFRGSDHLYRFGGEEFVVLMRCATPAGAHSALERLRRRVADTAFPQIGHLTVSAGFTRIGPDDTPEQAFGRADRAVYAAKEGGRDRIVDHDELAAAGEAAAEPQRGSVDFF